jgi:hypothetical protein
MIEKMKTKSSPIPLPLPLPQKKKKKKLEHFFFSNGVATPMFGKSVHFNSRTFQQEID